MRKLIVLMALLAMFGTLALAVSGASANGESSLVEPKVKSDCPPSYVCVWEGPTFGSAHIFFHGYETGTHNLNNLNCVLSAYNHTGEHVAVFPEWYWPSGAPNLILEPGKAEGNRTTCHHTNLIIA